MLLWLCLGLFHNVSSGNLYHMLAEIVLENMCASIDTLSFLNDLMAPRVYAEEFHNSKIVSNSLLSSISLSMLAIRFSL